MNIRSPLFDDIRYTLKRARGGFIHRRVMLYAGHLCVTEIRFFKKALRARIFLMTVRESAMQPGRATARAIREMIRAISMSGIFRLD